MSLLKSCGLTILAYLLNTIDLILWSIKRALPHKKEKPLDMNEPWNPNKKRSILLKNAESVEMNSENEIGPFRGLSYKDGKELCVRPFDGINTIADLFDFICQRSPQAKMFGSRKIVSLVEEKVETYENNVKKTSIWKIPQFAPLIWQTCQEVHKRIENISKGLSAFTGLTNPGRLAIYHETCQEWMMLAQACFQRNVTVVTVYSTLGKEAVAHALAQSEVATLFVNEEDLVCSQNEEPRALHVLQKCSNITHVIYKPKFPHEPENIQKQFVEPLNAERQKSNIPLLKIIRFDDLENLGSNADVQDAKRPQGEDLAFIMYTSGTTGIPKGVMLTHANIVASTTGLALGVDFHPIDDEYIYLGYLPMAHIMEMACEMYILLQGGRIGYGTSKTLFDKGAKPFGDFQAIKPTFFTGVPRVCDTLKKTIITTVNDPSKTPFLKKFLFDTAFAAKKRAIHEGRETPLWNALVFKKFAGMFGGNVQNWLSGGAQIAPETQDFLRVVTGSAVIQGYGLTETGACGGVQANSGSYSIGNNGGVIPSLEMKLVSVPEMNYLVTDKCPRGEICFRGPCVSQGYYKNPEENAKSFDKAGYFHTGDIGMVNENGTISIIDRKKNIVKLAHGEYIALEKLESVYGNSRFVAPSGCMCYGDPLHSQIVALVLPDVTYLKQWCMENNIISNEHEFSLAIVCKNQKVVSAVYKDLLKQAQDFSLCKIEYLKAISLVSDEWTPNNYLTASLKLKRSVVVKDYQKTLEQLYI